MARVLRHPVEPRLPLLTGLVLAACGAPISNAPFIEEPQFVSALLTLEEIAPPSTFDGLIVTDGSAPLLQSTLSSIEAYRGFIALPAEISAQLGEVGPTTRTAQRRVWAPSAIVVPVMEGVNGGQRLETLWVGADVLKIADGRFEVRVDVADTEAGPFETVGTGLDDGNGGSLWQWELGVIVDLLGLDTEGPVETLELGIDPDGAEGERLVQIRYGTSPAFPTWWLLSGANGFAFNDRFAVTTDGLSWPGQLGAVHTALGGVAVGEIDVAGETIEFASCWGPNGNGLWQGSVDPRITWLGDPEDCPPELVE